MKKILIFLFALLETAALTAQMTEQEKKLFWHKCKHLKLYHSTNRGFSAKQIRRSPKFKVLSPRPAPIARFRETVLQKKGSIGFQRVPVSLLEEYGTDRVSCIRFGLPLPEGGVFSAQHIRIVDGKGKEVPSQVSVTGFWKDRSIRWALCQFTAPLKAGETKKYFAEFGSRVSRKNIRGITFEETDSAITVNTGKMKAVIDKKKFNLIRSVSLDGRLIGGFSPAGVLITENTSRKNYALSGGRPDSVEISEKGPVRLTVRVAGKYYSGKKHCMSYVARISFYAGSEAVDIEFTHINTELSREFTDLKRMCMVFTPAMPLKGLKTFTADGKTLVPRNRIFQETDEYYSVDGGKRRKGNMSGVAIAGNRISFGIAHAWERYPKALSKTNKNIVVELLPQQPHKNFNRDLPYYLVYPFCDGLYRMKWGMSFTERVRFDFSGSKTVGAELNKPVIAVLPPSWYDKTNIFPGIADKRFAAIDKKITGSFNMRVEQARDQREYGFFNYGDSFGEKGENWTNNEYDIAHGLFMTFLRTGNRKMFRFALAAARHQADVDICHAYPDPYYVGGNLTHRAGHTGNYKIWTSRYGYYQSAANGHTWSAGMVNAWNLFGEASVMDAALLLGDHIALAMAPHFKISIHPQAPRECAWAIRAVGKLYEATLDPVYFKAMKRLALESVRACKASPTGFWIFANPRLVKERGERSKGNVVFIAAVGLKGLCEYYALSKDESLKPVIRKIAMQILNAFEPANASGFAYDLRHDGKKLNYSMHFLNMCIAPPLAEAAVILKDSRLYDTAARAMAAGFLRTPGVSGKYLGEYLAFTADFLAAHKHFPQKYKLDFSDLGMLDLALSHKEQLWNLRAPDPGVFELRLRKTGKIPVVLQRWVWPSKKNIKKADASIEVTDSRGKCLLRRPFDSSRGGFTEKFTVTGKKGEIFRITVRDHGNGDWCVLPSPDFRSGGVMPAGSLRLARCGLKRFYFEVPANQKVSIFLYGTHAGGFGYWLFDENDKLIQTQRSWQPQHALSKQPLKTFRYRLSPSPRRRICSVVLWGEMDGRLKIYNSKYVSGSKDFFEDAPSK